MCSPPFQFTRDGEKALAGLVEGQRDFADAPLFIFCEDGLVFRFITRQEQNSISIALHELAQTTGILVIALAQLNRNAAHTSPSTADLKESGQLEQDADAILLLSGDDEKFQAILAKNKEGRVGEIPLTFDKTRQRFLTVTSELEGR